jgi:hypothetical protein
MLIRNLVALAGYRVATWPAQYSANQLLGLRITSDRFTHRGILPGDFAVILKRKFTKISDGDLIAIPTGDTGVEIAEYSSQSPPITVLGRIIRSWRDY